MNLARRIAVALVALLLVAATATPAPPAAPEQIAWAPGLQAAQAEARERKVPLMVVLNMDAEPGNERMVAEVYTDPAVREAAKRVVATVASISTHPERTSANGRKVCSRFGHVTCAEHRATEEVVRTEWLHRGPKDDVESPRHIFRAPDGRYLFQRVWTLDAEELVKLIDRAVSYCAPDVLAAWDTTPARLQRITDPMSSIRQSALTDLLGAHDAAIDAQVFDLLRKTENEDVARDVLAAMAADVTPTRAEGVRKALGAPAPGVRAQAAAAVACQKGKEAFDLLLAAYGKERNAETKAVMLRALAACGGDPAKTRETVLRAAKSGDAVVRVHAIVALAAWAKEDAVVDAIRKLPANDKVPEGVRSAACWTLGMSGRKDVEADLKPVLEEKSEWLVRVAKSAIAQLGGSGPSAEYVRWGAWLAPLKVTLPAPDPPK